MVGGMRGVVVLALVGVLAAGSARAIENGCAVRGTRALPVKVKADGESFVFFRASEYRVRVDGEPMEVTATAPLKFRGVLGMPLPGVQLASKSRLGPLWLSQGAEVKLVEAHGRRALVDIDIDGAFSWRTELDCAQLEVETPQPMRASPSSNARAKTRVMHVGLSINDANPLALTVTDRARALVSVRRRVERFAQVEGHFSRVSFVGWVPLSELEPSAVDHPHAAVVDPLIATQAPGAAPERSHRARVVAGATVYAAAGKRPWATTASELREWIADGQGEWVEVRGLGEHVWVKRSSVVEGWSAQSRKQRRQALARAVQP